MQEKNLSVIIGHCSNWIKVRSQVRRLYLRHGRGLVYAVAGGDCWASDVHLDRIWTTGDYINRNTAALHRVTVR